MRTTLTLDEDVAHQLRERARLTGNSFKDVVNEAIRSGLQAGKQPPAAVAPFRVSPRSGGFRSGTDLLHLNQLNDELAIEDFQETLGRPDRG